MGHYGVARDLRAGLLHGTIEITEEGLREVVVPDSEGLDFSTGLGSIG